MNRVEENQDIFSRIVGEQLSAVNFVMDYLVLQFNDYFLTVLTPLVVRTGDQSYRLGDLPYRDALCERITHNVREVVLTTEHLDIGFDDDVDFDISLKEKDRVGAEAIIFQFPKGKIKGMLVMHIEA